MFTSSWGQQNQQQQQPQQQTGAFGQPTGFGATNNNAFGSTSAFTQPQQQPQVNPMFGNIGAPSTSAFGAANNNANTSAFGVKPATGFGAFSSGTGAFGGGTTTGAFGQPVNNQASTSTSVFGQPASTSTTSPFGAFNKTFGSTTTTSPPVVTTGTANPPYNVITEKDQNITLQFNSISCMPQYAGYSAEELRVQDYAQGRKTAATATGAFGQPTAFGATQQTNTGLFGAQPAQQATPSLFGGTTNTNTTNANTTFGTFGQPLSQPATTNTGNLFGGGAFGQPQQQQQQPQQSAFGGGNAFGQPQQQPTAFGGGTSTFGSNAPKPAFTPFGGGGGTTSAFGSSPSAFGNTQQQQTQQPSQNLSTFGNTQPTNNTSAFGTFGATLKPPVFGTQTNTTQPSNTTFGAFGNSQPQPNQPNQQSSIFGNTPLFGNQQQQPQNQQQGTQPNPLFGGSQNTAPLFGNTNPNTGNIFGNNQQGQQQQQQQQGQQQSGNAFGGLFGSKPAQIGAPLFGQGQLQGNINQTQQNPLFGSSFGQSTQQNPLFANKPVAPTLGNSFSGSQGMSTGIFGASANVPGAQGTMTASISQPIGENLPIFAMLPPGPRIVNLEQSSPKKKGGFFVDVPTRSPIPRVLGYTPANSKLRGYGTSLSSSTAGGNALNGSMSLITGKPNALALTKTDNRASSLGPDGFLGRSGSPALGSGGRESVKKVILDKKVEPTEFFVKSGSPGTLRSGKITFSPALGLASRERDAIQASTPQTQHLESPTPAPRTNRSPNRFTAQSTKDVTSIEGDEQPSSTELKKGDYWVNPDLQTLKKSGHDQLSACEGLVVGRKGYGEIHFLEPVDLTGLPKLRALLGEVIRFDDKECSVYPDSEEVDKPPPGSGLNVKAKLSLEGCWAVDKATREPITDGNHPSVVKHLKRLKNMKDTHFEGFDMKTGTWTFTVDHF